MRLTVLLCTAALLVFGTLGCATPTTISALDAAPTNDSSLPTFTVSGTVIGLVGTGLVLQNIGANDLEIAADGSFTFAGQLDDGASYSVTVGTQPTGPSQICEVTNGSGTIASADVADLIVDCSTSTFTVEGIVTGLVGTGLVLQNNGTDLISVSEGAFVFPAALASGSSFNVSVQTQPDSPTQSCNVSGGTGTIGSGNVTSVVVNCATDSFTVGGIVSGLSGAIVLQNNGTDDITLSSNGSFAFPTVGLSGASYSISVQTQPSNPSQTCLVTAGTGTVGNDNVTSIRVDCVTDTFIVGGMVAGLAGSGLVLQNNAGDNLSILADGTFTFATPVASGATYAVTVLAQPSGATQVCSVANGSGSVGGAEIADVSISCSTSSFTVGGTVTGLLGSGLTLQNNTGDDILISANGTFTFSTPVASGGAYAVTVLSQPTGPTQTCTVSAGTGTVGAGNVTAITVNCATDTFTVGGTVSGLAGTVVLRNNGSDDLTISSDGSFAFSTPISSGGSYVVTVATQPLTPTSQTCTVTAGNGPVGAANITSVSITCTTNQFTVSGTVTGLSGSGLVLQNNGGDDLLVSSDGAFVFSTSVASNATYEVTTIVNPASPSQTCIVGNGAGVMAASNVSDVTVNCTTDTFPVGGTVSGLSGTGLVIQNNSGDDLAVGANGSFAFATEVLSGESYAITVLGQPSGPSQTCTVSNSAGAVTSAAITSVIITCATDQFSIGGTASGLIGSGLVLQNNSGDDLSVGTDGIFTFATDIDSGSIYSVTVLTQPTSPAQTCIVTGAGGTVGAGDVTSVNVNCTTDAFSIGGTISGLSGTGLVLQNSGGNDLAVSANGSFAFSTPILSGEAYAVTVLTQPSAPTQTCTVAIGTGTVGGADVSNVSITCTTTTFTVGGTLSGLALGQSVVLRNNGASDLTVAANGSFTFSTSIASGQPYAVTVLTQPSAPIAQTCVVSSGAGIVTTGNITNISVTCTTNTQTIGGTLLGLAMGSVVLQNNGGDDLILSADGSFTFTTPIASGDSYSVAVFTQPGSLLCAVSSGSGTVTTANITNVTVTCSVVPTGGTITTSGGFRIHTFTSAGNFETFGSINVEYLVVAGGGGGGSGDGAGAGAGGVLTGAMLLAPNSFAVVIGAGGAGATTGDIGVASVNGSNSSFAGLVSLGGGRGGQEDNVGGGGILNNGGGGGSGGGFGGANAASPFPAGGSGTVGQGNNGGTRGPDSNSRLGMGGGGGAGGAGGDGGNGVNLATGGAGGVGVSSSISGAAVFYGGGGGGSGRSTSGGAGGQGGGGAGGFNASGSPGAANTGGGGGGGGDQATSGGAGGTGIIIVRYPI